MLEIKEVVSTNKKLYKQFVDFPNVLYKGCPYYIPYTYGDEINLLNPNKNPAFEQCTAKCFIAIKDGVVVGRIAGLIQKVYNAKCNENRVRFTRFDFINDLEVVQALLGKVEEFAKENGMDIVHGPFGFYDMDRETIRVKGFDQEATLATNYNYEYYYPLIKQCGYSDEYSWNEFKVYVPTEVPEKVKRVAQIARERYGLVLVKEKVPTMIKKYSKRVFDLYDKCYSVLHGAVPLTPKVRQSILEQFKIAIIKDFFPIVLNSKGEVVGVGIAFAGLGRCFQKTQGRIRLSTIFNILKENKKPTYAELAIVGVDDAYRQKGAMAMIMEDMIKSLNKYGIKYVDTNPELVTNAQINQLWTDFEKEQNKSEKTLIKHL